MTQSSFDSLLAAIKRAEETHLTDEDAEEVKLSKDILELVANHHIDNGGPLDTHSMLTTVAFSLGLLIRFFTRDDTAIRRAIATQDYLQAVVSALTEED